MVINKGEGSKKTSLQGEKGVGVPSFYGQREGQAERLGSPARL